MKSRPTGRPLTENRRRTQPIPKPKALKRLKASGEEGYILIAVLFLVVMVLIALSVAAPKMAASIERDREVELMHRGKQYRRAIQLYYKKFGAYPPNMDALEKTSEIRFLRRRYKDPVTGKDEWHLIHFGENKLPTAYGFFGQPLNGPGGSTLAGTGPGGVGQNIGSSYGASPNMFGGQAGQPGQAGTPGSNGISGNSQTPSDPNANNPANPTAPGSPSDPNANSGSSSGSSIFGGSSTSGSGQTFGGGGIIGVESTSPKQAILEYHKKKHFNEWEFVYDPQQEMTQIGSNAGTVGQPMSGAGNSPGSTPSTPSLLNQNPTQQAVPPANQSPSTPQQ